MKAIPKLEVGDEVLMKLTEGQAFLLDKLETVGVQPNLSELAREMDSAVSTAHQRWNSILKHFDVKVMVIVEVKKVCPECKVRALVEVGDDAQPGLHDCGNCGAEIIVR